MVTFNQIFFAIYNIYIEKNILLKAALFVG